MTSKRLLHAFHSMPPSDKSTSLRRGTACLCCRKKKLKCDGNRPICKQCSKMGRADQCKYDDKRQKSRTQKLRDKLQLLETRLKELEHQTELPRENPSTSTSTTQNPTPNPPLAFDLPVNVADPTWDDWIDGIPFSGVDPAIPLEGISLDATAFKPIQVATPAWNASLSHGDFTTDADSPTRALLTFFDEITPGSSFPTSTTSDGPPTTTATENLPLDISSSLISTFLAHRHQCWFDGDINRYNLTSFGPSQTVTAHLALVNAIYLLGCYFSRSPSFDVWEQEFYKRTISGINSALTTSDRLVDIVRASSLLSSYLYAKGRNIEAYGHAFAACRMAIGLGLHRLRPTDVSLSGDCDAPFDAPSSHRENTSERSIAIDPPRDSSEWRERAFAFWQAFSLDRCWSTALGLPAAIPHGSTPRDKIITPWISPSEAEAACPKHLRATESGQLNSCSTSGHSLRVKVAALYERAVRLHDSIRKEDEKYLCDLRSLESAFKRFSTEIPPLVGVERCHAQYPLFHEELLLVHTLAHITSIYIIEAHPAPAALPFEKSDAVIGIASTGARMAEDLRDSDYEYLDPFLSACWFHLAKILVRFIKASSTVTKSHDTLAASSSLLKSKLESLIHALNKLSFWFSIAGDYLRTIQSQWEAVASQTCSP